MLFGFTTAAFDHVSEPLSFNLLPLHEVLRVVGERAAIKTNITTCRTWLQAKSLIWYVRKGRVVDLADAVPQAALAYKPFTTLAGALHVASRVNPTNNPNALQMLLELHAACVKVYDATRIQNPVTLASLAQKCCVKMPAARYRAANAQEIFGTQQFSGPLTSDQVVGFVLLGKDYDPFKDELLTSVSQGPTTLPQDVPLEIPVASPIEPIDLSWLD